MSTLERKIIEARIGCFVDPRTRENYYCVDTVSANNDLELSGKMAVEDDATVIYRTREIDGHYIIKSHKLPKPTHVDFFRDEAIAHSRDEATQKMLGLARSEAIKLATKYGLGQYSDPDNRKVKVTI